MRLTGWVFAHPRLYRFLGRLARQALRWLPRSLVYNRWNVWGRARELPESPTQSFHDWYAHHRRTP
jgi:L-lactate dehydrogenase complex protein LldF